LSYQPPTLITRKARLWPEISKETIALPTPPRLTIFPAFFLFSVIFSSLYCACICLLFLLAGRNLSGLVFACLVISGLLMLSLGIVYVTRLIAMRAEMRDAQERYCERLQEAEKRLQELHRQEMQARIESDPPLVLSASVLDAYEQLSVVPLIKRSLDERDARLWARRPGDPDFLSVRFGLGQRPSSFQIQDLVQEPVTAAFANLLEKAHLFQYTYSTLPAPLSITLYKRAPVALVGGQQALPRVRTLVQNLIAQLAYHHSPQDLRILVLAPQTQNLTWQWARALPHTLPLENEQGYEANNDVQAIRMVALGTYAINEQLSALSRELARRELLLHDLSAHTPLFSSSEAQARLPHLVVVVDYFEGEESGPSFNALSPTAARKQGQDAPLQRSELIRALYDGPQLGVSVICIGVDQHAIPANSSAILQLSSPSTVKSGMPLTETTPLPSVVKYQLEQQESGKVDRVQIEATLHELRPDPPPMQICQQLDLCTPAVLHEFAGRMQRLQGVPDRQPQLRMQVDLRSLFVPALDLSDKQKLLHWQDGNFRTSSSFTGKSNPLLRVPIGMKTGDELQYLDLLKDGPHGLLIGQAGSGKNELLQSLLLILTLAYRPSELNLLLIEQGRAQTLTPFRTLPHTLSYLAPAPSAAEVQRFLTMLYAEVARREERQREGKSQPRLLILVNEFLYTEPIDPLLEALLTLESTNRMPGIHLLFVAESLSSKETNAATRFYQQIRDLSQYRICLRCSSVEESRALIYRDDAAFLPASLPGRGYLLHGEQQLDLFQGARLLQPGIQEIARPRQEPSTDKDIAAVMTAPVVKG
jgi:DNA segregation ATPase FtsK/SpoIIIE-like protein